MFKKVSYDSKFLLGASVIFLALAFLYFVTGCANISLKTTTADGDVVEFSYLNWKKVDAGYENPQTGERFWIKSNPEPWAELMTKVFEAGFKAGSAAVVAP